VKPAEIVDDAVRRDRALDTYERVLEKHLADREAQTAAENQQLEEEIARRVAELRGRIDENTRALELERKEFQTWQAGKRQEEATIAAAVGYFVSENPITTTRSHADKGEADVR
jgi:C4-dicarboxylate-specific signal transduction histidine kinase